MQVKDEYHDRISEKDLDILRKSLALVIITPFCSIALMYIAKELKREYSFSGSFIFNVRLIKERFLSNNIEIYGRSSENL
jgi:hypothetical protein